MARYIYFDWVMMRILRRGVDLEILEGFLTSLLGETVRIQKILDTKNDRESVDDEYGKVDILAKNDSGELVVIELHNYHELYYLSCIFRGVSKLILQNIESGQNCDKIKKVYVISIVYLDLIRGKECVYHGTASFRGHRCPDDVLKLSEKQEMLFRREVVGDITPEYYIVIVGNFDGEILTPLDEWVMFLKTGDVPETAKPPRIQAFCSELREDNMSETERKEYYRFMENRRDLYSMLRSGIIEGRMEGIEIGRKIKKEREKGRMEGIEKGIEKGIAQAVLAGHRNGFTVEQIMAFSGLSRERVLEIINSRQPNGNS
ncbi:MAG: Rpn family recombination-promoting nuclease/putative transposase [Prevotellaceae bacterium]|jgi:predicted transposase/invertase (TIGR01784 family)|nr:Rpn family recombination-promoting nuclease/putative transposase [Prevotellaceae bacterium]